MIDVQVCGIGHPEEKEATRPATLEEARTALDGRRKNGGGADDAPRPLWVDVVAPTDDDWRRLVDAFDFHPLAVEDARKQGQRPKVDDYDGYLFLSIHAVCPGDGGAGDASEEEFEEIDLFIGPDFLVTVHTGDAPPLHEMRRRLARAPRKVGRHPAQLMHILLDAVVDAYFPVVDALDAEIERLEEGVYAEGDRRGPAARPIDIRPALRVKKRLLELRQAVAPMRDVLNTLLREDDENLMPRHLVPFYQDVYDHTLRLTEQIDTHREFVGSVLDAMAAQTGNRMNEVMKTLTAYSLALMAATLIAGIYGMNFERMPELKTRFGYPAALGLMALAFFGVLALFRRRGWL